MKYTFGTCRAAAERLEHMAGFFNPRAERLVREYAPELIVASKLLFYGQRKSIRNPGNQDEEKSGNVKMGSKRKMAVTSFLPGFLIISLGI